MDCCARMYWQNGRIKWSIGLGSRRNVRFANIHSGQRLNGFTAGKTVVFARGNAFEHMKRYMGISLPGNTVDTTSQ